MTEILIRPAVAKDAKALGALGRATFIDTFVTGFRIPYPKADLEGFLNASFDLEPIRKKLAEAQGAWWVAERDGQLAGFANAGPNGLPHEDAQPGDMELRRLYIARDAQGLGLGTRLLTQALDWMQARTQDALWIGVWSGNEKAIKLYGAYGFEKA
ncbi:hypothetical protein LTR94_027787, partial [Friedmanniomyces endolithicus]